MRNFPYREYAVLKATAVLSGKSPQASQQNPELPRSQIEGKPRQRRGLPPNFEREHADRILEWLDGFPRPDRCLDNAKTLRQELRILCTDSDASMITENPTPGHFVLTPDGERRLAELDGQADQWIVFVAALRNQRMSSLDNQQGV